MSGGMDPRHGPYRPIRVQEDREKLLEDPEGNYAAVAEVGKRMGLAVYPDMGDWYVGYSPRNGFDGQMEGAWCEWVALAHWILQQEERPK